MTSEGLKKSGTTAIPPLSMVWMALSGRTERDLALQNRMKLVAPMARLQTRIVVGGEPGSSTQVGGRAQDAWLHHHVQLKVGKIVNLSNSGQGTVLYRILNPVGSRAVS